MSLIEDLRIAAHNESAAWPNEAEKTWEMRAICGLAEPHALENVQTWTGAEGGVTRLAVDPLVELEMRIIGHTQNRCGGCVIRLD